ncbi:hypothetical protein [Streptomyces sp. S.PNR 29]|uniref:hypothetical protein n=1 Tax=Streptomyces sp. S.PNR 29 TaxID=2973805 RepID=UPI0025AF3E65|nr:hypothetical protein [Streptomyces sp. S.PNR 29]MDN0193509.1 hypothetical protein [Streptomyces sp. S.PNR 29]
MEQARPAAAGNDDLPELTLVVETALGVFVRTVPAALPLPEGVDQGTGAEMAAHRAAATWGLPDFVCHSAIKRVSSGQRELGDRMLLTGSRGVVVQVKSREGAYKDDASERNWLRNRGAKAARQAKGTVRSLRSAPAEFENGRGQTLTVDGNDYQWIGVVVLDHDRIPDDTVVDCALPGLPCVALARRDRDFLFDQLRSTTAVVNYLFRVANMDSVALGDEPVRYYDLAAADADAPPGEISPEVAELGGIHFSVPLLPQAPVGSDRAHRVMRLILEDIAISPLGQHMSEANRLLLLSEVDELPVGARAEWGQLLLDMLREVRQVPPSHCKWRWRRSIDPSGTRQMIFGCATRFGPDIQAAFQSYVLLRHHELHQQTGLADQTATLGVLLTLRTDGTRPWDTTLLRTEGDNQLTPEEVKQYSALWNRQRTDAAGT